MARVLLVDDETKIRGLFAEYLCQCGHEVVAAEDGLQAKEILQSDASFDVVLCDLVMPNCGGEELFRWMRETQLGHIPFVCISGQGGMREVMAIVAQGAFDFISKPLKSLVELRSVVERAAAVARRSLEAIRLDDIEASVPLDAIVGRSPKFLKVAQMIAKVSVTSATVLITGESGTGKEVVARAIHRSSPRWNRPFIALNCAAMPSTLIESELFGHEKGAFTGAIASKPGKFLAANHGTLLLDEIGEMDVSLQSKLLRVIQEKVFEPVGSTRSVSVDVRILAATNRDLDKMVQEGGFRRDLLYRLRVYPIHLPPLRERREDIVPLLKYLTMKLCKKMQIDTPRLSQEGFKKIMSYSWPGNIRELENTLEHALIECTHGLILPADIHIDENSHPDGDDGDKGPLGTSSYLSVATDPLVVPFSQGERHESDEHCLVLRVPKDAMTWNEIEYKILCEVLQMVGHNVSQAAKILAIPRSHLRSRLRFHGLGK